jgi:hypothetical protein
VALLAASTFSALSIVNAPRSLHRPFSPESEAPVSPVGFT